MALSGQEQKIYGTDKGNGNSWALSGNLSWSTAPKQAYDPEEFQELVSVNVRLKNSDGSAAQTCIISLYESDHQTKYTGAAEVARSAALPIPENTTSNNYSLDVSGTDFVIGKFYFAAVEVTDKVQFSVGTGVSDKETRRGSSNANPYAPTATSTSAGRIWFDYLTAPTPTILSTIPTVEASGAGSYDFAPHFQYAARYAQSGLPSWVNLDTDTGLASWSETPAGSYGTFRITPYNADNIGPAQAPQFSVPVYFLGTQRPQVFTPPFDAAGGAQALSRGSMTTTSYSQVAVTVFDAGGDPVVGGVTGTVSGASRAAGQGNITPFATTIDLTGDAWAWQPQLAAEMDFEFTVAGLNAGYNIVVTITSWD